MTAFLDKTPPRMRLVHLKSQDSVSAQYNPTEINEKLSTVWNRLKVLGQSFEELQYLQTKNQQITFALSFDEKSATGLRYVRAAGRPQQLIGSLPQEVRTSDAGVTIRRVTDEAVVTTTTRRGITSRPGSVRIARQFLLACMYPSRGAQEVRDGAPSRLLMVWPGMWSLTCRLVDLTIGHTRFDTSRGFASFTANLKLEVDSLGQRLTYEDVLEDGTIRHDTSVPG